MPKIKIAQTITLILLTLATLFLTRKVVQAGMAGGISTGLLQVTGEIKTGSIVAHKGSEYVPTKEPFDTELVGVIVENSSISLVDPAQNPSHLVMQAGEAQVLVSTSNGDIKRGDYITSSTIPGVGQKADKTGFILGKATEDFVANGSEPGLVWATIEPKNAYINNNMKTNLLDALKSGSLSPLLNPVESLRYMLAALIVAATFIIGFSTFGKSSGRTIEALGRNPLAQKSIKTAMIFNMILAFGVMLIGLALAYLILVL